MRMILWVGMVLGALAGCAVAPSAQITRYDFGPMGTPVVRTGIRIPGSLSVERITAPPWFDDTDIIYRLAYLDPTRRQAYSQSRWVASPEDLLTQRLRQKLDAVMERGVISDNEDVKPDYALRVDLEEFSQVFDTPQTSRAEVRLRASLLDVTRQRLIAQHDFGVQHPGLTPNAAGAVHGLLEASDATIDALTEWLVNSLTQWQAAHPQ